uniref:transposase n=1 Tax=Ornithinibacillus californiensis TaxID=161536 RepID=UPI00064DD9B3
INNSKRLKDAFGVSKGNSLELARALASCIYDIENNLIVKALITKCTDSERHLAKELLESFKENLTDNDLFLFDRGYPSIDFFDYLVDINVKFIIRTPINNYKAFIDPSIPDQLVEIKKQGKIVRLRAIRIKLSSGQEELLLTNIVDKRFKLEDFKVLYFKRWGIESKFDELKNKLKLQKFTGDTPLSVEQDYYATMFLSNMASFMAHEVDEIILKEQEGKNLEYLYKSNTNIIIGKLKSNLIHLILEDNPRKRNKIYKQLLEEAKRSRIPIRPGRSYKRRTRNLSANRNGLVQKAAL